MAGTALAQVIPIAAAPLLTRMYTPSEFGLLALFTSLSAVCGVVACGRYDLAVVLPEKAADAAALVVLCAAIALGFSISLLVCALAFSDQVAEALGNPDLAPWLPLVAPVVLLTGVFSALGYLATRSAHFPLLARARVVQALTGNGSQVALGLALPGPSGLVLGNALSSTVAMGGLVRSARRDGAMRWPAPGSLRRVAARYSDFPKFSIASALAQTASLLLVGAFLTRFYSAEILGQYSLVTRILAIPLALIGGAVAQVFFQRASASVRESGGMLPLFRQTLLSLSAISAVFSIAFFFLLPGVFAVAFGDQWREAGDLARYLIPGFAMQFVVAPLTMSNLANDKVRLGLAGDLLGLCTMMTTLVAAAQMGASAAHALLSMSVAQALFYAAFLVVIYRHVRAGARSLPA